MATKKILIVDDSPTIVRHIYELLHPSGYNLITASDGEQALSLAVSEQPHLVILDVVLPKKNGFQVCRQLKTTPDTQEIKILMLTSKTQDSDRFWGLKQGADGYMTKPFEDDKLLSKVSSLL